MDKKLFLETYDYKVVILGAVWVGKSSITIHFVNKTFTPDYNPTLQETYRTPFVIDEISGFLKILDTAGDDEYIVMQDYWIKEGHAFILVYAIDNMDSFDEIITLRKRIEKIKNTLDIPLILVGNKADLELQRKVPKTYGINLSTKFECPFFETSAMTGLNCHEVVILGSASVGKSSITIRFVNKTFSPEYNPTLQETFRTPFVIDEISGSLEILDTAGQDDYIVMQDHWIKEGHAFILVYAIDNMDSFDEINTVRKRIERVRNSLEIPMILVGNKVDLELQRKVSRVNGVNLSAKFNCPFLESSALTGLNCNEVFYNAIREIRKKQNFMNGNPKKQKKKNKIKEFFMSICVLI